MVQPEHLDNRLLNDYQRGFPLSSQPFTRIAGELGTSTGTVLERLHALQADGKVSRVGPVFRPNTVGVSTLAAMAVPTHRLATVAQTVNAFTEVNHNYEREHRFNLWFVVTAGSDAALADALARIECACGYAVLSLPLERDYHIDLGFHMSAAPCATREREARGRLSLAASRVDTPDAPLIGAIQGGLALVERPFRVVAREIGGTESGVIRRIGDWLSEGTIKRFGVIVRHHELGYRANAMAVWDVPDTDVEALGCRLGNVPWVTLCYRRRRHRPDWPFNLYCMIHGRERDAVRQRIEQLVTDHGMAGYAHAVLFSRQRFKQRGARYHPRSMALAPKAFVHGTA